MVVLDMLATLLAAGDSTYKIGLKPYETGVSQIYLCIYPDIFGDKSLQEKLINEIIDYTHNVEPMNAGDKTYYPGERSLQATKKNLKNGIPIDKNVWQKILELLG